MAIALLLTVLPAAGQEIIQRMERDVLAATKPQQQLEAGPLLGLEDLKKIALFGRFGRELRSEESGLLRRVGLRLSQGDYAVARKEWELALGKMKEREFTPDVDALVHGVLKQAYLEKDFNFQPLAEAVKFREEQQKAAHTERQRMERRKAAFDEGKATGDVLIRRLSLADAYAPGAHPLEWTEPERATAEAVAAELQKLAALCNSADANAQKALVDLQEALEGQILQTMSNASKMLRDTAKAIIQNVKA